MKVKLEKAKITRITHKSITVCWCKSKSKGLPPFVLLSKKNKNDCVAANSHPEL